MKQRPYKTCETELSLQKEKNKHLHNDIINAKSITVELKQENEKQKNSLEEKNEHIKSLEYQNKILQVKAENTEKELEMRKKLTLTCGLINALSTILVGFGINMLTTNNSNSSGLIFIGAGIILTGISLIVPFFIST